MLREKSCGGVVYTKVDGEIRYLLVQQHHGRHGFPKGHVEANETERETALREIREETGLNVTFVGDFRMTEVYNVPKKQGALKTVVYFLAYYENQQPVPQLEELMSIELLPLDKAIAKLEIKSKREILKAADKAVKALEN